MEQELKKLEEKIIRITKIAFQCDGFSYREPKPIYVAAEILERVKDELLSK